MKRKTVLSLAVALTLVLVMFIPSVQAFAVSALSVFRVGDAKTITITATDIEEIMAYFKKHEELFAKNKDKAPTAMDYAKYSPKDALIKEAAHEDSMLTTLADVSEFSAFSVKLPKELKNEQPVIKAADTQAASFSLDVTAANAMLEKLGDAPLFDTSLNGAEITVNTPPMMLVEYSDLLIFATQGSYIEADRAIKEELWNTALNMPFIPSNLRTQLAAISVENRDVYLPVILGVGREVSVGGSVGYIYSAGDLLTLMMQMPVDVLNVGMAGTMGAMDLSVMGKMMDTSVLVWTHDGVLYFMAGDRTDSELAQLARSMS